MSTNQVTSEVKTFWLFLLVGLLLTLVFGVGAIIHSAQKPLNNAKNDFVQIQNQTIEQWAASQIAEISRGLEFLARRPIVVSTTIGETENNEGLLETVASFDLIQSMAAIYVVDVLGDEIAHTIAGPKTAQAYSTEVILDFAKAQFGSTRAQFTNRLHLGANVLLVTTPILYGSSVEGAVVGIFALNLHHSDFQEFGLESAELRPANLSSHKGHLTETTLVARIPHTDLDLVTSWNFDSLDKDKRALMWTLVTSLLGALVLAYVGLGILGQRLLLKPQKLLQRSREELIKSERRARELAEVAELAKDAIIITDALGRITWSNTSFSELSGYSLTELVGQKPGDILQGTDTAEHARQIIATALAAREPIQVEILNYSKAGKPYWVEIAISPVFDGAGELVRFIAVERDVSAHKAQLKELKDARVRAEAANEAKSNFLATMSHEIRTPLNGVIGMAEALQDTALNDEQRMHVETITQSGVALLKVINGILDYSMVQANEMKLVDAPFNLQETVEDVLSLVSSTARAKAVEVVFAFEQSIPKHYLGDQGRIQKIITNLVGNAVKFTLNGSVLVSVSGAKRGGAYALSIEVQDSGIGIPDDKLDELFTAFQQVEASTNRRFEGTGLGLAISSGLARLMDGRITVKSELNVGTTFVLQIELREAVSPSLREEAPAELEGKRVLVVDDSDINRRILEEQLRRWNMKPALLEDAASALAHLRNQTQTNEPASLIILDYDMPGMTGEELAAALHDDSQFSHIPKILLSSCDGAGTPESLNAIGIVEHLLKPAREAQLLGAVSRALSGKGRHESPVSERIHDEHLADSSTDNPITILVAEDNKSNQRVLRAILKRANCQLVFANNGEEAIQRFREVTPSLVLMDWSMPKLDGLEATKLIREFEIAEHRHRTPIIALTANALEGDREICLAAGMDDYLSKPIRREPVRKMLQKWNSQLEFPTARSSAVA